MKGDGQSIRKKGEKKRSTERRERNGSETGVEESDAGEKLGTPQEVAKEEGRREEKKMLLETRKGTKGRKLEKRRRRSH